MSRRRYLSTTISTDKAVNRLAMHYGDFAALLYTWLIPHAADDCSFPADPEELMMIVMPGRRDKEPVDIQTAIDAMLTEGLVLHDPDNHDALIFPPKSFYGHQTYIKEERQRKTPQNSATLETAGDMPQNSASRMYASSSVSSSSSSSFSVSSSEEEERVRALTPLLEFGVTEDAFARSIASFPDIPLAEMPAEADGFVAYYTGDRKKPPKNCNRAWTGWLMKSRQFRRERVAMNGHAPPDRPLPAYVLNRLDDTPIREDLRDGF